MPKSSLITACGVFLAFAGLHAHDLHTSTAEAEFNSKTQTLEVSLTVFVDDLELALMRQSERLMSIEKTPAAVFDEQVMIYLAKHLVLKNPAAGRKAEIRWVGRQIDDETKKSDALSVTLFFEFSLLEGSKGVSLQNSVLQDLFKDQLNLLSLRNGHEKVQMQFKSGEDPKPLDGSSFKP
jgi:hypothetical protein